MKAKFRLRKPTCTLLTVAIILISLIHVYFDEAALPILPIAGAIMFGLVHVMLLPRHDAPGTKREVFITATLLLTTFLVSAYWGELRWGGIYVKALLGFAMGLGVLVPVLWNGGSPVYRAYLEKAVTLALGFHLAAWVIQGAVFYSSGQYLDYVEIITGMPSRYTWALDPTFFVIRPTGFFAEPTPYATYVILSVGARLLAAKGRMGFLDYLGLASVALSLSLIGYLLVGVLVIAMSLTLWRRRRFTLVAAIVGVVLALTTVTRDDGIVGRYLRFRLGAPTEDSSGWERLVKGFDYIETLPLDGRLFGLGLGNYDLSAGSTNGLAYLLESFGIVGTMVVAVLFLRLLWLVRPPIGAFVLVGATLIAAPAFSAPVWWLWAGQLAVLGGDTSRRRSPGNRRAPARAPGVRPALPGAYA